MNNKKLILIDYDNNKIEIEKYLRDGKSYNSNGPTYSYYYSNKNKRMECWKKTVNKIKFITFVYYYDDGSIRKIYNSKDTEIHHDCYPAIINYYKNGFIQKMQYYKNDMLHNSKGPAIIEYNEDGKIINQEFYLNGKQVDELAILINYQ